MAMGFIHVNIFTTPQHVQHLRVDAPQLPSRGRPEVQSDRSHGAFGHCAFAPGLPYTAEVIAAPGRQKARRGDLAYSGKPIGAAAQSRRPQASVPLPRRYAAGRGLV